MKIDEKLKTLLLFHIKTIIVREQILIKLTFHLIEQFKKIKDLFTQLFLFLAFDFNLLKQNNIKS